jgi:aspartyl-tRNA(Asn)/glutamyl-tRNA(Gln) amidotransferase subunit B
MKYALVATAIIQEEIDSVKTNIPLLPQQRKEALLDTYLPAGITESDIDILLGLDEGREIGYDGKDPPSSPSAVAYFEKLSSGRNAKTVMNW